MKFRPGDRVLMIRHSDWKADAVGTIITLGRWRVAAEFDGGEDYWYWIEFDEPQRDYTDEMHGLDRSYKSSTVAEKFLRSLEDYSI